MVEVAAAAPPLEPRDVPASGGWADVVPNSPTSPGSYEKQRTGRLTITYNGQTHYCTAQLIRSGGSGNATLLLTAAHCARPGSTYSFVSEEGGHTATVACVTRNHDWDDTDHPPFGKFINARLDYAFLKIKETIAEQFDVQWENKAWKDAKTLEFRDKISVVGYPDPLAAGTVPLSILNLGALQVRPDFYHRKLNAISTTNVGFTKGTSGGAWLDVHNSSKPEIVSLTSSYIGKTTPSNSVVGQYITIYGPILHKDAKTLAVFAENSPTTDGGECQDPAP